MRTTLLAALAVLGLGAAAQAAPVIYATGASIVTDGPRGTANDRDDIANAFGAPDGSFFELGYRGVVDFVFGQRFRGPGALFEITFGNVAAFPEAVRVLVGNAADPASFTQVALLSNLAATQPGGATFDVPGVFDTVRLIDASPRRGRTGGWDVDSIAVAAVPLPAAGGLLLAGLGALALRRRRA